MSAPNSIFVRACKSQPVDRTPVWFMRQAGRYMPEYRAVRKRHSLLEICKKPALAAEVTITAAEFLGVDAAIIFADLLLPLEVMGLPFHFSAGEGPVIEKPVRTTEDVSQLRTDRAAELGYVSEAVGLVAKHFAGKLPVIGFCGAPFTLASYMIEGGGSRHYLHAKKMMYNSPADWDELMRKLVDVTAEYSAAQVRAGADVIQIFAKTTNHGVLAARRSNGTGEFTGAVDEGGKRDVARCYCGCGVGGILPVTGVERTRSNDARSRQFRCPVPLRLRHKEQ